MADPQTLIARPAPAPDAWVERYYAASPAARAIPWDELRNRPLTAREHAVVREFYGARYQVESDYNRGHPWHSVISAFRVRLLQAAFPRGLGRVVDAGCASGETVLAFRDVGIDCVGFDICPDLHDACYDRARPWLRMGRVDAMPFSERDELTTLVSYDVFEHVPIDRLERLPVELARLGIRQISCVIAADTGSAGHITIQDTDWYLELFARAGFRLMTELTPLLQRVPVPGAWNERTRTPVWLPYDRTGEPRNGWNQVPGQLFLTRD